LDFLDLAELPLKTMIDNVRRTLFLFIPTASSALRVGDLRSVAGPEPADSVAQYRYTEP
jgi:hypothetical protein